MNPSDIVNHDRVVIAGNARLIMTESDLQRLSRRGDAVGVHAEYSQPTNIPQHHAASPEEFTAYVEAYGSMATRLELHCLFRGQTRDYFSGDQLAVRPAGFRSKGGPFSQGLVRWEWVQAELMPWLICLSEVCGIDLGRCIKFMPMEGEFGVCRWITTRALKLTGSSLGIIGILQHYGLPTYFLDVTPSPSVAAWFALNRAVQDADGVWSFVPSQGVSIARTEGRRSAEEIADVPCVQVYLQKRDDEQWPVLDLRTLPGVGDSALRPNRQEAFFLPFMVSRLGANRRFLDKQCWRSPTAVIKLYFRASELQHSQPELSADHLLPRNDPLYGVLWEAQVPRLTNLGPPLDTSDAVSWREAVRRRLPRPDSEEPLPGSIVAETPNVAIAYDRARAVLQTASISIISSSQSTSRIIIFHTQPGHHIPQEVHAAIQAICAELHVEIALVPADSQTD